MYHGIIYKYTSPEHKSYIGQTTKTLAQRAQTNGQGYKQCPVFYEAILKYGWDNFTVEILYEITTEDLDELIQQLNVLEAQSIKQYQTLSPFGYNLTPGGDNKINEYSKDSKIFITGSQHPNWKKIDENYLTHLYQIGKSCDEIANIMNLSRGLVQRHLHELGLMDYKRYNAPVVKYQNGQIVGRWNSASEASRDLGVVSSTISRTCREKRRPYKGVTYRFEGEEL